MHVCTTRVAEQLAIEDYKVPPFYMQCHATALSSCCSFSLYGSKQYCGTCCFLVLFFYPLSTKATTQTSWCLPLLSIKEEILLLACFVTRMYINRITCFLDSYPCFCPVHTQNLIFMSSQVIERSFATGKTQVFTVTHLKLWVIIVSKISSWKKYCHNGITQMWS